MEMASYLAGERWSDHPKCTHPLVASVARMVNDNTLRVEGCVMGGIFCGGQRWTRVASAPEGSVKSAVCSRASEAR